MIDKLLVAPLGHVSNTIVDDYVRLLVRGRTLPAGTLVETTARWVQFETDFARKVESLFMDKDRLAGIDRILWPMYCNRMHHFALLVIGVEAQTIALLDSIVPCRKSWKLAWLQGLLKCVFGWRKNATIKFEQCRLQGNNDDCGVYTMANLRSFVDGVDFNASRMPGEHLGGKKDAAVVALRAHFARELREEQLHTWK